MRIAIEHESRAQVRTGRSEEFEAVLFGPRERALVRQDDALVEGHHPDEGQKATPRDRTESATKFTQA